MTVHGKVATTQRKIKAAFIYLVNKKGLSRVTVKDITQAADINRSTFYKHFVDKPALVNHYEQTILTEIAASLNDGFIKHLPENGVATAESQMKLYATVSKIVDYIYEEFDLAKALLGPNGDPHFEDKIKRWLIDIIDKDLDIIKGNHQMTPTLPNDYAHEIIISQILDIIKLWLTKDNPEPPQQITEIIMRTRYMSPHDILGVTNSGN